MCNVCKMKRTCTHTHYIKRRMNGINGLNENSRSKEEVKVRMFFSVWYETECERDRKEIDFCCYMVLVIILCTINMKEDKMKCKWINKTRCQSMKMSGNYIPLFFSKVLKIHVETQTKISYQLSFYKNEIMRSVDLDKGIWLYLLNL